MSIMIAADFYPRPPRGGRPKFDEKTGLFENISIHALREEGDLVSTDNCQTHDISIHALREEGDIPYFFYFVKSFLFLSTPSARRATT